METPWEFLNSPTGVILSFLAMLWVGGWAYKKNKTDHEALGKKVEGVKNELSSKMDSQKNELSESIRDLGVKIDAVREAISHHEEVWHAPRKTVQPKRKRAAKKR